MSALLTCVWPESNTGPGIVGHPNHDTESSREGHARWREQLEQKQGGEEAPI